MFGLETLELNPLLGEDLALIDAFLEVRKNQMILNVYK